jgi:hypothetical protein
MATTLVASADVFCPGNEVDMNNEASNPSAVTFVDGGWVIKGGGRVSSKTSWNLLGGFIEFDMNVSRVVDAVNTNLYTTSPPQQNCGAACYCDIQKSPAGKPSCMELDLLENNGRCLLATTIHTFATDGRPNNRDCDRWGCQSQTKLPRSGIFHIHTKFGLDGAVTVYLNGEANVNFSPSPSQRSNEVVVQTMQSIGAVVESSQWFGWVPGGSSCPAGRASKLSDSVVSVSNLRVNGTVKQGPTPTVCAAQG